MQRLRTTRGWVGWLALTWLLQMEAAGQSPPPGEKTNGWSVLLKNGKEKISRLADTNTLEAWHDTIAIKLSDTVERFDKFFGDERLEDENEGTRIQLGLGLRYDQKEGLSLENDFNARLALPALEKKLQLLVDNIVEKDDPRGVDTVLNSVRDSEPNTALRYITEPFKSIRINYDAGVRWGSPLDFFGRVRARRLIEFDDWDVRLSQTCEWFFEDGFSETTEMRWSRKLDREWLFRSSSAVTWAEGREGVTPTQSLSIYREISKIEANRLTLSGNWPEFPQVQHASYRIESGYRRLIHSDWLYVEFQPGVEFAEDLDYDWAPYCTLLFDLIF